MDYTNSINEKIAKKDGNAISTLFKLKCQISQKVLKLTNINFIQSPFSKLLAMQTQLNSNPTYTFSENLLSEFLNLTKNEDKWILPVFKRILVNTYTLSLEDDKEACAKIFTNIFKSAMSQDSKKPILIFVTNLLLNLYFKLENYKLADELLVVLEKFKDELNTFFNRKDVVTFNFYRGVLKLYRDEFMESYTSLRYSFKYCSKSVRANIALYYFISCFFIGLVPKDSILKKYDCFFLSSIFELCIKGKVLDLDEEIENNKNFYIQKNLYRTMTVCMQTLCFRFLSRMVFTAFGNDNKLEVKFLMIAHKSDTEFNEMFYLLMNLIELGYVKGYISLNKEVVVFSRNEPFPKLSLVVY